MAKDYIVNFVQEHPLSHIPINTEPLYPYVD